MADGDLFQADFDLAFAFGRSEAASYRTAGGAMATAAADVPRFDHDATGTTRGLLLTEGSDIGRQDRAAIDPLILPVQLLEGTRPTDRDCTVLHEFAPIQGDGAWMPVRQAWYSRDARRTIDALLQQQGHHLQIGVISGFRENDNGVVRYRGAQWAVTGMLFTDWGVLHDGFGRPLISAGAEKFA